ncbi:unnamed protein product [Citrullus colocynthis]|uniref:RBR-type E3 ubiquitin transferase n=1 Tax=Citrullus colocynthis TaxID=252529 RepID=A0ABP0XQT7_9ROSI
MLPKEITEKWNKALCKALYSEADEVFCPFEDCSEGIILEKEATGGGGKLRDCECPFCHRLFCATCKVPWHEGITCDEYQTLYKGDQRGRDDILMKMLASKMKWMKCPKCNFFVEKVSGVDSSSATLVDHLGLQPMAVANLTNESV